LFQGTLLSRCFDISTGISIFNSFCGNHESQCLQVGEELGKEGLYVCGKMLDNPNFGVTSFDNFYNSALMVWQVITMEGWTFTMYYIEASMGVFTNIYFLLIIFIGAFFLVNLTLAVITIFFIKA
jgi:hypothetical protein